jgi:hypothetical protein
MALLDQAALGTRWLWVGRWQMSEDEHMSQTRDATHVLSLAFRIESKKRNPSWKVVSGVSSSRLAPAWERYYGQPCMYKYSAHQQGRLQRRAGTWSPAVRTGKQEYITDRSTLSEKGGMDKVG